MKTSLEHLEPTKVKLTVEVEAERVKRAFDEAAREIAKQVQIPGFRKGKVPRKLLEQRIGKEAIASQAVEGAVSSYYAEAVQDQELRVVAPPEVDLQTFSEEEGCAFEATVEVRPEIELPDHEGIDVSFPEWDVTDEEVQEQIDQLRERFAELDEVDREARIGDYVTIDLTFSIDGEPIEDAAVEDALYEVGTSGVTPKLDEELAGAVAGQELTYTDVLPDDYPEYGGQEAEFTVTLKDVRAKQLPEADDDFATTASEFETYEELEADIRDNLLRQKLNHARQQLRARVLEAYLALVEVPLPEVMVNSEIDGRMHQLQHQAERYGIELDELLEAQGMDLDEVRANLEEQARTSVKAQLVLETLAEQLDLEVASADLGDEIQRHAAERGIAPEELARVINEQGSVGVLVGDVMRRKTLDLLVASANIEGAPDDDVLESLEPGAPAVGAEAEVSAGAVDDATADVGEGTEAAAPSLGGEAPPEGAEDATTRAAEQGAPEAEAAVSDEIGAADEAEETAAG